VLQVGWKQRDWSCGWVARKKENRKGVYVGAEAKEREWKEKKKLVISARSLCECFCKLYQTGSEWGRGSRHRLRLPWGCFRS
jgi:hypothetical protein